MALQRNDRTSVYKKLNESMIKLSEQPTAILHIGAGACEELPEYLSTSADRIILVEPNPKRAHDLRKAEDDNRIQVLEAAITDTPDRNQLIEYNLPQADSLYQPTSLHELFPGLRTTNQYSVITKTPAQLLEQYPLNDDNNVLVIQAPGAEEGIINGLANAGGLDQISHIYITANQSAQYEGAMDAEPLLELAEQHGYSANKISGSDPEWPQWHFTLNPMLRKFRAEKRKLKAEHQKSEKLAKELEEAKDQKAKAEKRAQQLTVQVKQLEEQLASAQQSQSGLNELRQHMDYLFGQQSLQLEQAANALGRHVSSTASSTAKNLEAGIRLQQEFGQDLPSLEEASGTLSSTLALKLSQQIKSKSYDLIIELGSGITTAFMAQTLRKQLGHDQSADGKEVAQYIEPSEDDLPKRIVCFEHDRNTHQALQGDLESKGLSPIVSLQFAPLVPFSHQGQDYLFFDCASRLQQIAKLYEGRQARIFVLVNQSGNNSQPDSYAALPQLLQYLSAHTLEIVVSTQGRAELVRQWNSLLEERGLDYQAGEKFGDKQYKRFILNP